MGWKGCGGWNNNCYPSGMNARQFFTTLACLTIVCPLFGQTPIEPVWANGLKFKNGDGSTSISVGGRLHYDAAFIKHSAELDSIAGPAQDKLEVRTARLSFEETIEKAIKCG